MKCLRAVPRPTASAHTLDAQQKLALCGEQISAIGGDKGDACMRAASAMTIHTYTLRIEIDGKSQATAVEDGQTQDFRASNVGVQVVPKGFDASGRVSLALHVVDFSDDKDGFGHGLLPDYALLPVGMTARTESLTGHQIGITVESIHD